jgi:hypothetical protein
MSDDDCLMAIAGVCEHLAFLIPSGDEGAAPEAWSIQTQVRWCGPDGSRGRIVVALDQGAAVATAANLLGLPPGQAPGEQDVRDACSELSNVIAGNLLPVLYGQDHEFHLCPPEEVAPARLSGRTVLCLALLDGTLGVAIQGDADNSRILKAVRLPTGSAP